MNKDTAQNLPDAFDLITRLRRDKPQRDLHEGIPVSSRLDPALRPTLQHPQLNDRFELINQAQNLVRFRFGRGL